MCIRQAKILIPWICTCAGVLRSSRIGVHRPVEALEADIRREVTFKSFDSFDLPDTDDHNAERISVPPRDLHGKNLILIGDSNERRFTHLMCNEYGGKVESVKSMTCDDIGLGFPMREDPVIGLWSPTVSYVCHLPKYNMSIMNFFFFGAMSMTPEPAWHYITMSYPDSTFYNMLPYANRSDEQRIKRPIEGNRLISPIDLMCFWRSAIDGELEKRPLYVVAQSSLWDSVAALAFLRTWNYTAGLSQNGLSKVGWKRADEDNKGLDAWGWIDHASELLKMIVKGFAPQKLYWRTNPNCPMESGDADHALINQVSDAQAAAVRKAVLAKEGIWSEVELIDWREHFVASKEEDCQFVHYSPAAEDVYIDLLSKLWSQSV